jgi:hypothetical protein
VQAVAPPDTPRREIGPDLALEFLRDGVTVDVVRSAVEVSLGDDLEGGGAVAERLAAAGIPLAQRLGRLVGVDVPDMPAVAAEDEDPGRRAAAVAAYERGLALVGERLRAVLALGRGPRLAPPPPPPAPPAPAEVQSFAQQLLLSQQEKTVQEYSSVLAPRQEEWPRLRDALVEAGTLPRRPLSFEALASVAPALLVALFPVVKAQVVGTLILEQTVQQVTDSADRGRYQELLQLADVHAAQMVREGTLRLSLSPLAAALHLLPGLRVRMAVLGGPLVSF